ncbi:MAG TPA: VCBS repeat-containing protein [Rhodanobacteraceae bacterium]|nr:VCBS repeat-containing protein [Rhodanobacteraceae bacterium]
MMIGPCRLAAAVFACVVLAAEAAPPTRTAIAPDGRVVARAAGSATATVPVVPAGEVPYAATPDWQNTLRIQVGGLAFGDLDGDGHDDLAVGCFHSNSFPPYDDWHDYVYFNTGNSLESDPSWQSADQHHTGSVGIADIDGDGRNDLLAARGGFAFDPSVVYYGSPGGLATTAGWQSQVSAWAVGMALADIDGDGDIDLVTANQGNSPDDAYRPLYLFRNDGSGLAVTPDWQSAELSIQNSVAAGDLTGDGMPDLAVAKWVDFESAAYANLGGTPDTQPYWTAGSTDGDRGVAIADFDGDGDNDILLGQATLTLYDNQGGNFVAIWHAENPDSDHQDVAVADINGDGWPDVAEVDFARGKTWIHLNHAGQLDPVPAWSYDAEPVGNALAFGDVNGDGLPDLAIGYSGEPSVVVFLNQGTPPDDTIFRNGFD